MPGFEVPMPFAALIGRTLAMIGLFTSPWILLRSCNTVAMCWPRSQAYRARPQKLMFHNSNKRVGLDPAAERPHEFEYPWRPQRGKPESLCPTIPSHQLRRWQYGCAAAILI